MQKTPPTLGSSCALVALRAVVLRDAAVPLERVRRALPLAPKSYTLFVDFNEATQLSDTADVRISGVRVGRVKKTELHGSDAREIEIEARVRAHAAEHARDPAPEDAARRDLRGDDAGRPGSAPSCADGGMLPPGQVEKTVELDEIMRRSTSRAARPAALRGRVGGRDGGHGADLSDSLGNCARSPPRRLVLDVLDASGARCAAGARLGRRDPGRFGRRQGELSGLVRSGDRVLSVTGAAQPRPRGRCADLSDDAGGDARDDGAWSRPCRGYAAPLA